ncbi:MAG TPA: dTDP-4-dehydrorhamnose reductase [Candidatus Binatia bacterium]|jgi:dTDP-4-dehydrorhamnose reductase|nr:dTDP-4-dehydrorhamnose reductase [Candidatus Binatia bacterium]
MRILLTGAGAQLGQALQATLTGHHIIALDHPRLDILQLNAVREAVQAHRPDLVLNTAAFNNVDGAESDPEAAYRGNALGPRNLAVVTAAHHLPLLHISTDYVFDGTNKRPYHEFDNPRPCSVYGASKLAGEEVVRALNPCHYIVRTAWLYHTVGRNFPKTMCALANQPEVRVVSDQYGSPTYAPHLATAIARLIPTGAYGTYHFAGQGGTSWFELTRTLYRLLGIHTLVRPVATADFPRPAERPCYSVLTTIQDPYILLPPWEEGLAEFVRALRSA